MSARREGWAETVAAAAITTKRICFIRSLSDKYTVDVGRLLFWALTLSSMLAAAPPPAKFTEHTIATGLRRGYQVVVADLNRDGKPDLIALASGMPELVWFENPSWERHVI